MNSGKINDALLTRKASESGRDATASSSLQEFSAGTAEKPVLTIYLADFRSPSLNEILKKHWSFIQKFKSRCSRLMGRAALSLREAMDQQDRLTTIILWEGLNTSGTRSQKRFCADPVMPKVTASCGNTVRSRGKGSRWKYSRSKRQKQK